MEFGSFNCRVCGGKLVPRLNELICSNCNFIQHPLKGDNLGISCENLKKKLDSKSDVIILDVREKWEFGMGNLKGATSIPMRDLEKNMNLLDKNKEIVAVCHHNERSSYATRYLLQNGFKNVKYLEGGIDAWAMKIDNSIKRY